MHLSSQFCLPQFVTFTLVFVRVATLVVIAPVFGSNAVPLRVRAFLALALAVLVAPVELQKSGPHVDTLTGYAVLVGAEALIGLSLGLGVLILFSGMQVAGQLISQMSGMQLAEVVDPGFDSGLPAVSQLLFFVALAVFVTIGGHRRVMEALLDTFVWMPAGQGGFSRSLTEAMTSLLAESFVLGVRAAAPAMIALVLATLILGLASRTLPQLNVMALGFGLNALTTLVAIGLSLGGAALVFQDQLEPMLTTVLEALKPATATALP